MNKDHSAIFETASKYYISDSFVDYGGYSIASKGFLPTVVDIAFIWVKFSHSRLLEMKELIILNMNFKLSLVT